MHNVDRICILIQVRVRVVGQFVYVPVNLSNSIGLIQSGKIPVSIRNSRFA